MKSTYYGKENWPIYDFRKHPPLPAKYQIVRKTKVEMKKKLEARI